MVCDKTGTRNPGWFCISATLLSESNTTRARLKQGKGTDSVSQAAVVRADLAVDQEGDRSFLLPFIR